jgi:hypothetical protein
LDEVGVGVSLWLFLWTIRELPKELQKDKNIVKSAYVIQNS